MTREIAYSASVRVLAAIDGAISDATKLTAAARRWPKGSENRRLLGIDRLDTAADAIASAVRGSEHESWALAGVAELRPPGDLKTAGRSAIGDHARAAEEAARSLRQQTLARIVPGDEARSFTVINDGLESLDDAVLEAAAANTKEDLARLEIDLELALRGEDVADVVLERTRAFALRDPDDLSKGEWRQLHTLLTDERSAPHLPELIAGERAELSLAEIARRKGWGAMSVGAPTRRAFARLALQLDGMADDPVRLRAHLTELVNRNPEALTGSDWARFDAIIRRSADIDLGVTFPTTTEVHPDVRPLHDVLEDLTSGKFRPSRGTSLHVRALRQVLDPDALRLEAADILAELRRGRVPASVFVDDLADDSIVWTGVSAEERTMLQARSRLLGWAREVPATRYHAAAFIQAIERELKHVPQSSETIDLVTDAKRLIDHTRKQLQGRRPEGTVRGYARHPDYANLGRLGANAQLIARLTWPVESAAPVATNVDDAAAAVARVADDAGALTW